MKDPKVLIDVSIITMTAFLGVPILVLGLQNITLIALTLYLIFPVLCLSCGVYCGSKNGFQLYYPVLSGILFLPSLLLFFDWNIWMFPIIYVVLSLLGVAVGSFYRNNNSGRQSNGRLR